MALTLIICVQQQQHTFILYGISDLEVFIGFYEFAQGVRQVKSIEQKIYWILFKLSRILENIGEYYYFLTTSVSHTMNETTK